MLHHGTLIIFYVPVLNFQVDWFVLSGILGLTCFIILA